MKQTCKPGSVSAEADSCHLSAMTLTHHLNQPTHWGALCEQRNIDEPPLSPTYLAFQPTRFSRKQYHYCCRELLPHVFTLTRSFAQTRRYSFLRHFLLRQDFSGRTFPLGSVVPCAARTFLPYFHRGDKTVCFTAKITSFVLLIAASFLAATCRKES